MDGQKVFLNFDGVNSAFYVYVNGEMAGFSKVAHMPAEFDITEAFKTPLAIEKQWILLDEVVTIERPENTGGMNPGIEGWEDEFADLPM